MEKGRKGEKETEERRKSRRLKLTALTIITALRILHWISGLWFGIWDFFHLVVCSSKTKKIRLRTVISHWAFVISKEAEAEKGRKGERRQETEDRRHSRRLKLFVLNIITALRILHWISGLWFGIWSLGFYSFSSSWRLLVIALIST